MPQEEQNLSTCSPDVKRSDERVSSAGLLSHIASLSVIFVAVAAAATTLGWLL